MALPSAFCLLTVFYLALFLPGSPSCGSHSAIAAMKSSSFWLPSSPFEPAADGDCLLLLPPSGLQPACRGAYPDGPRGSWKPIFSALPIHRAENAVCLPASSPPPWHNPYACRNRQHPYLLRAEPGWEFAGIFLNQPCQCTLIASHGGSVDDVRATFSPF